MGRVNTASSHQLSVIQQEVLIGTLFGDGRLESRSHNGSARLRVHHSESQRAFLFWKYKIFQDMVTHTPWRIAWKDKRTGNICAAWFFHTRTLHDLRPYHQLFYREGRKIVPEVIDDLLTPRALATWFMDDGCTTQDSAIFNTQGFSKEEHIVLQHCFARKLGIITTLNKDRSTFRLRMNRENANRLRYIIEPYVPKCMQYKLTPRND